MDTLDIAYIGDLTSEDGVNFHTSGDDTRLYYIVVMIRRLQLENCIKEVSRWMSANRLKLTTDETELLWAGLYTSWSGSLGSFGPSLRLGTETVVASDQAHVLGLTR